MRRLFRYRRFFVVIIHLALFVIANFSSFLLRFDGTIPGPELRLLIGTLPMLMVLRGVIFIPFRLYEGLWRYTDIWDIRNIAGGVFASSLAFYALVHGLLGVTLYPRSVFIIDSLILTTLMVTVRLTRRAYKALGRLDRDKRVLIFGAGDAGEMIVRDMKNNAFYDYEPIGFIDDDPRKVGQRIHHVPVLGSRHDLPAIIKNQQPHEVLIAITNAEPAVIRSIVRALEPFKVPIKVLPNLSKVVQGTVAVSQIRNLSIEDLLPRAPVGLDVANVQQLIQDKCILITGAGGSIGSELARQIAQLRPSHLILFERYENSMYTIVNELVDGGHGVEAVIGDITDAARVRETMRRFRPDIVFHAAAHKHVPLMELNPAEAVKNNVIGTRTVADAAAEFGVQRFILISTDKAVNASSIMGATKRVAELLVLARANTIGTIFSSVRFGNVLGSNGSVVPRFLAQIKDGGPVTVTHPEMRRYFMLIPEAVQLVLHAASMAERGFLYVLEMGEQLSVLELARNLIRLSGFVPDEDIPIQFIGLRPGEKLYEELVGSEEALEPSPTSKVLRVRSLDHSNPMSVLSQVSDLERLAKIGDIDAMLKLLSILVPSLGMKPGTEAEPKRSHSAAAVD